MQSEDFTAGGGGVTDDSVRPTGFTLNPLPHAVC